MNAIVSFFVIMILKAWMKTGLSSVNMDVKDFDFVRELCEIFSQIMWNLPLGGRNEDENEEQHGRRWQARENIIFSFFWL